MEISSKPFGAVEVTFPPSLPVDRVHAEALCALIRTPFNLASHSTDHGKLVLRMQLPEGEDAAVRLRAAAEVRVKQLRALLAASPEM